MLAGMACMADEVNFDAAKLSQGDEEIKISQHALDSVFEELLELADVNAGNGDGANFREDDHSLAVHDQALVGVDGAAIYFEENLVAGPNDVFGGNGIDLAITEWVVLLKKVLSVNRIKAAGRFFYEDLE